MRTDLVPTLTNMARPLLKAQQASGVDRKAIEAALAAVAPLIAATTGQSTSSEDLAAAAKVLETVFVIEQGAALSLKDRRRPPDWYVGEKRRPGPFMSRYLDKLAEANWPEQSIDELRESTVRVLEVLDDPGREGPWDWRGLVVGDVQSGKTAHYAGVVNRAADAGYRVIVILAGMHNVLRLQTQDRLESDFLGYDTDPDSFGPDGRRKAIGVGQINPRLIVDSLTLSTVKGDFSLQIAKQANFAPLTQPCLLVVKKNGSILKNLNRWIARLPDESRRTPLLVIDDEADQASIDIGDQPLLPNGTFDEDYDPTRINGEIRKLLGQFNRSAYVAYTATPFANILMHDERTAADYGADLFPATFILSLTPSDDYFGPLAVFGTNDEGDDGGLPLVRHVDQTAERWIPDTHDKTLRPTYRGADEVPPSLALAIDAFLLSCAARAARGQVRVHNSMLVHVSRFVDVHEVVHRQVKRHLDTVRALISGGDPVSLQRLEQMWKTDFEPTTAEVGPTVWGRNTVEVDWEDVLATLSECADKIRVAVTNGKSKTGLDYDLYEESGLSIIAIGGDKLSRGLTLEGLSVSYFLRISKQYDSLLQMGRWFGYRRGFADLCRLYTTPDMEDWFRHVTTANKDLRAQLAHMQLTVVTPKEYGLRVAGHSIMTVTAANKQRHATARSVAYAGEGKIQTTFFRDKDTADTNADLAESFIESLGPGRVSPARPGGGPVAAGELWHGVSGRAVADFIRGFAFPPENYEIEGRRLAAYIEDQMREGELIDWSMFLATGDRGKQVEFAGRTFPSIRRTPRDKSTPLRFIVRSILNPPDEAIDLTDGEFAEAFKATNDERALESQGPADRPSGPSIRTVRGKRPQNGLLIIYPLDPDLAGTGSDRPLIGLVTSFPDSDKPVQRMFLENAVSRREQVA